MLIIFAVFLVSSQWASKHNTFNTLDDFLSSVRSISSDAIMAVQGYTAFLVVLFLTVLVCNMFGMIPYTLTVTSFALMTFTLSFTSFVGLNLVALTLHRSKLVDLFLPSGAPLVMS